jgi:prophage antirepressor-like protein
MPNTPQVFHFDNQALKVFNLEDGPWFIAMEIAEVLNYSDTYEMTKRLDDDEKQNRQIAGFGNRGITLINESGLYNAILKSAKAEAKRFKKWVTSEVLPAIRKNGYYDARPRTPAEILLQQAQLLVDVERRQNQLADEQARQADAIRAIEARQEAIQNNTHYFSVLAYANNIGMKIDTGTANKLGRRAVKMCEELGHLIGRVPDARWGGVNTYPVDVLEVIFNEFKQEVSCRKAADNDQGEQ